MTSQPAQSADLRDKVADMLAENDRCGTGPLSRSEYLDDADAILRLVEETIAMARSNWNGDCSS